MRYIPATHSTDLTALIADFSGESADQCASRGDLGCGWVGGGFCNGGRQTIDFKPPPTPSPHRWLVSCPDCSWYWNISGPELAQISQNHAKCEPYLGQIRTRVFAFNKSPLRPRHWVEAELTTPLPSAQYHSAATASTHEAHCSRVGAEGGGRDDKRSYSRDDVNLHTPGFTGV